MGVIEVMYVGFDGDLAWVLQVLYQRVVGAVTCILVVCLTFRLSSWVAFPGNSFPPSPTWCGFSSSVSLLVSVGIVEFPWALSSLDGYVFDQVAVCFFFRCGRSGKQYKFWLHFQSWPS